MKKKIIIIISIIVGVVLLYTIFWHSYRELRYSSYADKFEGEEYIYYHDMKYTCSIFKPEQYPSMKGSLTVCESIEMDFETGKIASDACCDVVIYPQLFGGCKRYIHILVYGGEITQVYKIQLDEDMKPIHMTEEEQKYYEMYYDKVEEVTQVAREVFGL